MDIIFIEGLEVDARVGVYSWEKAIKQKLVIDIELHWDTCKAFKTDELEYALDYFSISQRVTGFIETTHFNLIETLAEKIAEIVRDEFGVPWLRLKLSKPGAVRGAKNVGVLIERGSKSE